MSETMRWLALAGVEVVLILLVTLAVLAWRQVVRSRRDRAAIERMIAGVRSERARREAQIGEWLSAGLGLDGGRLERARAALLRGELTLLQRFADTYLERDAATAARFHEVVAEELAPWLELEVSGGGGSAAADESELEALREENRRLSEELSVTMETMSRMLAEYSGMFAGEEADGAAEADEATGAPRAEDAGAPSADTGEADAEAVSDVSAEREVALDEAQLDIGAEAAETEGAASTEEEGDAAIDDLLAREPLAEGLGDLFDEDELDALGGTQAADGTSKEERQAIAI